MRGRGGEAYGNDHVHRDRTRLTRSFAEAPKACAWKCSAIMHHGLPTADQAKFVGDKSGTNAGFVTNMSEIQPSTKPM